MFIVTMNKPFHELAISGELLDPSDEAIIKDGDGVWYGVFPQEDNDSLAVFEKCANLLRDTYSEEFGYLSSFDDRFTKFYCYNTKTDSVTNAIIELFDETDDEGIGWRFACTHARNLV